jgi:hypothetical protein
MMPHPPTERPRFDSIISLLHSQSSLLPSESSLLGFLRSLATATPSALPGHLSSLPLEVASLSRSSSIPAVESCATNSFVSLLSTSISAEKSSVIRLLKSGLPTTRSSSEVFSATASQATGSRTLIDPVISSALSAAESSLSKLTKSHVSLPTISAHGVCVTTSVVAQSFTGVERVSSPNGAPLTTSADRVTSLQASASQSHGQAIVPCFELPVNIISSIGSLASYGVPKSRKSLIETLAPSVAPTPTTYGPNEGKADDREQPSNPSRHDPHKQQPP